MNLFCYYVEKMNCNHYFGLEKVIQELVLCKILTIFSLTFPDE